MGKQKGDGSSTVFVVFADFLEVLHWLSGLLPD